MKKRILTLFALCAALILLTAGAQAEGTTVSPVHAGTAEELMEYLTDGASNLIIELDAKDYVIYSTYTNTATGKDEQIGFSVENLNNVTIRGTDDGTNRTRILTPYDCGGYAVLTFTNCVNVTLDTLSVGHLDSWCNAPVLILNGSTGVEILNCDLWGCGYYGIGSYSGASFHAENTTIHDCSGYITDLTNCIATFDNCHFLSNGADSTSTSGTLMTAALQGSPLKAVFNNCDFTDNDCSFKIESGQTDKYQFNNCTETRNRWQDLDLSAVVVDLTDTASLTVNMNTGEAVISGTGAVSYIPYPTSSYIKTIEIQSGITSIGYICSGNSNITEIVLPDTLSEIGPGAFDRCTALKAITIPEGVAAIGANAFTGCTALTSANIPDNVTSIGDSAFSGCTSLTSANIPGSVTSIGDRTFYGCSALNEIAISYGVTSIGSYAFSGCTSLIEVEIPESVASIGTYAFQNCAALTMANIPNGVKSIENYAFSDCAALTEITIPSTVTSIGEKAFYKCAGLITANMSDGIETIEGYAFAGCSNLREVTIPDSVISVEWSIFSECSGLERITMPAAFTNTVSFSSKRVSHVTITGQGELNATYNGPWKNTEVPCTVEIRSGVTAIGASAFSGSANLTAVSIPSSVTSIGEKAFYNCAGLTGITLPSGITVIEADTFYGCSNLDGIRLPAGVTAIGKRAFYNCSSLTGITLPSGITSIEDSTFYNCSSLTGIVIPDSVAAVGNYAFCGCTSLQSVTLPVTASLTISQYKASNGSFSKCTGVTYVKITGTGPMPDMPLDRCCGAPWYETDVPVTVELSEGITGIGSYTFESSKLVDITLPDTVTYIGEQAFASSTSLTSVIMPAQLTSIGSAAFSGCSSLTSINIPSGVTEIKDSTFSRCGALTGIIIPDSVKSIGKNAFDWCDGLQSVTLPVTTALTLTDSTSDGSFSHCYDIIYIKVTGTGAIPDATADAYRGTPWQETNKSVTVELAEGVTGIGNYAFYKVSAISHITIPSTVTRIGDYAFSWANSLAWVEIPRNVNSIGSDAFTPANVLTDIYYGGTEAEWQSMGVSVPQKTTVHYNTTESAYISSVIDEALQGSTLAETQTNLKKINTDGLSEAMLDLSVAQKIAEKEGTTPVQTNAATEAPDIPASDISIAGAKVNFPTTENFALRVGAPSNGTITVPSSDKALSFSADLVSGDTVLSASILSLPVAITVTLPDEEIKPETIRVWHTKNSGTRELTYTSLAEDGRTLTFITTGFSDFTVTYDTPKPFSASLSDIGRTVAVVDDRSTLAACQTVYAALYDGSGKLTDLVSGKLSGNRITFTKPLTNSYVLFFLDNESVPLQSKTSLA